MTVHKTYEYKLTTLLVHTPKPFSLAECLVYLNRSELECLHHVIDDSLYKVISVNGHLLMLKISDQNTDLSVTVLNTQPSESEKLHIKNYIACLFDLNTDLNGFYELGQSDSLIKLLSQRYEGLRIIKIPDLFEAICWAIIGQQINLKFAYTLKKRFCETYGVCLFHDDLPYYIFPTPDAIANLTVDDLMALQMTRRKSEYIIAIAKMMVAGVLTYESLSNISNYPSLKKTLLTIRGIGPWTADYIILKCFDFNEAFPTGDVGLQNGVKALLQKNEKPIQEALIKMGKAWSGWEAYATFYIWRSLYDSPL